MNAIILILSGLCALLWGSAFFCAMTGRVWPSRGFLAGTVVCAAAMLILHYL